MSKIVEAYKWATETPTRLFVTCLATGALATMAAEVALTRSAPSFFEMPPVFEGDLASGNFMTTGSDGS